MYKHGRQTAVCKRGKGNEGPVEEVHQLPGVVSVVVSLETSTEEIVGKHLAFLCFAPVSF